MTLTFDLMAVNVGSESADQTMHQILDKKKTKKSTA